MSDEKGYYQYVPAYENYEGIENAQENEFVDKHPLYKTIPYYNNEIKSLQDINRSYPVTENIEKMYYEENPQFNGASDPNVIYNNGYPSYRIVNSSPGPRVVDLSHKVQNGSSSSSDDGSVPGSSRTQNVGFSEISKLTEAIKELTSRLPVPPSPELLKSVHPNLAVKLQLTYLKAYIQNQQLLMDLKAKIEGPFGRQEFPKYSSNLASQDADLGGVGSSQNYPIVELRSPYPQLTNPPMNGHGPSGIPRNSDYSTYGNNFYEDVYNFPLNQSSCPQLTNYPNFYYPLNNQPSFSLPQLTNYPQPTNYPQLTNYPHPTNYPQSNDSSTYRYPNGNYATLTYDKGYRDDESVKDVDNPATLVPSEYRDRVKYNASKKAFISVYLNSLGLRKRKSFSINKFGLKKALKMSIEFSNQLTLDKASGDKPNANCVSDGNYPDRDDGVRLALRERNLIEDVCEHALSMNGKSTENFELFERALKMDRVRGLVFSPGASVWMCIFYRKRKRKMQCFSVDEFGFDKCYQMGQTFFNNNPDVVRSKLSGVLSYWLESVPTKTLVVIFKTREPATGSSTLARSGKSGLRDEIDRLYLGRFELDVYGGFLPAKRAAQSWCSYLKKHPSQLLTSANGGDPSLALDGDLDRLGFVYYDHHALLWVVVNGPRPVTFSADALGQLESKKQALTLRQQHILSNKLTTM